MSTVVASVPWPVAIIAFAVIAAALARAALRGTALQRGADIAIAVAFVLILAGRPHAGIVVLIVAVSTRIAIVAVRVAKSFGSK